MSRTAGTHQTWVEHVEECVRLTQPPFLKPSVNRHTASCVLQRCIPLSKSSQATTAIAKEQMVLRVCLEAFCVKAQCHLPFFVTECHVSFLPLASSNRLRRVSCWIFWRRHNYAPRGRATTHARVRRLELFPSVNASAGDAQFQFQERSAGSVCNFQSDNFQSDARRMQPPRR